MQLFVIHVCYFSLCREAHVLTMQELFNVDGFLDDSELREVLS